MSEIDRELLPPEDNDDLVEHLKSSDVIWRTVGELTATIIIIGIIALAGTRL